MSEADNAWRVDLDGREHDVEVEHSTMTGKVVVRLDGRVVNEDRLLLSKKPLEFYIDGHHGRVTVDFAYAGFAARSSFHLDGRYVEPLRR